MLRKIKYAIDFIFPPVCTACGKYLPSGRQEDHLCSDCLSKIKWIESGYCYKCGLVLDSGGATCYFCRTSTSKEKTYYDFLRGVCVYTYPVKECIHKFKYRGKDYLAKTLGKLFINYIKNKNLSDRTNVLLNQADLLVPVPLHWWKKYLRGYNQSELLVKEVSAGLDISSVYDNLYRKKLTKTQASLDREKRLNNVVDAFAVKDASVFENKTILLIDDVCTTGETINQCAKAIRQAGANKIYGLALARDV